MEFPFKYGVDLKVNGTLTVFFIHLFYLFQMYIYNVYGSVDYAHTVGMYFHEYSVSYYSYALVFVTRHLIG